MKTKTILLSVAALYAAGSLAAPLTPRQALDRAVSSSGRSLAKQGAEPRLAFTAVDSKGEAAVYVFNRGEGDGSLFLSADDVATPLLGYTDEGNFDSADIPADVAYWLGEYARQIEYARTREGSMAKGAKYEYPTSWTYIAPLCSTKWDQGTPYNNQTPPQGSTHMPTGCVATAMAQVMKYWNYPEIGVGSKSYSSNGTRLSMSFDRQAFAWDNMLDNYVNGQYTSAQADAVSYLMKACGYGCEMQYAMGGSGTMTSKAGVALVTYFKYDSDIRYSERIMFTDSEWSAIVYDQLKNVGPVVYDGSSPGGGHAFVVDGYDGNGYFHINWGWGGVCNGFYLLTALNPTQQGTGGSYGGYNYGQGMLYNIKKAEGPQHPLTGEISMFGNLSATATGLSLAFKLSDWYDPAPGFSNLSLQPFRPTFGIAVQNADGTGNLTYVQGTRYSSKIPVGTYLGGNFSPTAGFPNNLGDGRYKVTLVYRDGDNDSSEWMNFGHPSGMHDYVYVTKSGSSLTVENLPIETLKITAAKILTPLYMSNPCQIEFTVNNPYEVEIIQTLIPTLSVDGVVYFETDSQLVAVGPGETVKKTLVYTFNSVKSGQTPSTVSPKQFILGAYDHNTNTDYGTFGTVTMYRSASNPKITLDDLKVTNAESDGGHFSIADFSNMEIQAIISVGGNNAFVASPVTAVIFERNDMGGNGAEVYEKEFENYIYLKSGDSATEKTTINFIGANPDKMYNLSLYYLNGTKRVLLGGITFSSTGVKGIDAGEEGIEIQRSGNLLTASSEAGIAAIEAYDMGGARIAGVVNDALDLDAFAPGLYIVRATDRDGNTKTIKVVK